MARLRKNSLPSYRLHKQSGQAIVTLSGKDFLLGPHDTQASRREYDRLVSQWIANGRCLPAAESAPITVNELILAYWRFARAYYRKNGELTSEVDSIEAALGPLKELYGSMLAQEFKPLHLLAVRERMIQKNWSRRTINNHVGRIRRMFKWAVPKDLVPGSVFHALIAVDGLRRGRSQAKETEPVKPVPDAHVDAAIAVLSPALAEILVLHQQMDELQGEARQQLNAKVQELADKLPGESPVAAMIQIQRLSGMRPGELVILRGCDIDMTQDPWLYVPVTHKTEHHGRDRFVHFGPRAQDILRPFLKPDLQAFLFSPRDAVEARWKWMR